MNEIAKLLWDTSLENLNSAMESEDINETIALTGIAEIALLQAQFAVNNPLLVRGIDEYAPPPGSTPNAEGIPVPGENTPMPPGPTEGPKFWGAPS